MFEEIISIAKKYADQHDLIQGAGGNISIKINNEQLHIKASGTTFYEINEHEGVSIVNHKTIYNLLQQAMEPSEFAPITAEVLLNQKKPSMEVGFHTCGRKYTLHHHSAYANVFLCSTLFEELEQILTNQAIKISLLNEYYTPGNTLSFHIHSSYKSTEDYPHCILLPNHGIIINADTTEELYNLNEAIELKLLKALNYKKTDYPKYKIVPTQNGLEINCNYLYKNLVADRGKALFEDIIMPDQALFLSRKDFSSENPKSKVYVDIVNEKIYFNGSLKEARAIAELGIAIYFINEQVTKLGGEILTINYDKANLLNMPQEQERLKKIKS
jgi:ribulose-5-phosphate 4-epimerase/fuculose-1-phosphate aldolase